MRITDSAEVNSVYKFRTPFSLRTSCSTVSESTGAQHEQLQTAPLYLYHRCWSQSLLQAYRLIASIPKRLYMARYEEPRAISQPPLFSEDKG